MTTSRTSARLSFLEGQTVALPHVAGLIGTSLGMTGATIHDVTLSGLSVGDDSVVFRMDLSFCGSETQLTLTATARLGDRPVGAALARAVHCLAEALPVADVDWNETGVRIPRAQFVAGLAQSLAAEAAASPVAAVQAPVQAPVQPRRIARGTRRAARPQRSHPVPPAPPAPRAAAVPSTAEMDRQEAQLRSSLLRPASEAELAAVTDHPERPATEVRLTTWAVSISVATVALPLALPVMAHNLIRGEDMRAASLAAGVAGLFVALDSSGAMAALPGF